MAGRGPTRKGARVFPDIAKGIAASVNIGEVEGIERHAAYIGAWQRGKLPGAPLAFDDRLRIGNQWVPREDISAQPGPGARHPACARFAV